MDGLDRLAKRMAQAALETAQEAAEEILCEAQAACPVDSGTLRASLTSRVSGSGGIYQAEISAGAPYAASVELGTFHQPARPFLLPAFQRVGRMAAAGLMHKLNG